jgi:hypothetical protein
MASAAVIPKMPTSFVYEDLVAKVQAIQLQIIESIKVLEERQKNELKSHSFTFVDPHGNSIVNQYIDHEMISTILKKYKKDYVPKYLQKWIKVGTRDEKGISPLTDSQMKSTVSEYEDGHQFITYGEVTVWATKSDYFHPRKVVLPVLLTDNMEKIKTHLNGHQQYTNIELKLHIADPSETPNTTNWEEGKELKSDDSIISCQLYQDNCIIMAKLITKNVSYNFVGYNLYGLFFSTD